MLSHRFLFIVALVSILLTIGDAGEKTIDAEWSEYEYAADYGNIKRCID